MSDSIKYKEYKQNNKTTQQNSVVKTEKFKIQKLDGTIEEISREEMNKRMQTPTIMVWGIKDD